MPAAEGFKFVVDAAVFKSGGGINREKREAHEFVRVAFGGDDGRFFNGSTVLFTGHETGLNFGKNKERRAV